MLILPSVSKEFQIAVWKISAMKRIYISIGWIKINVFYH